LSTKQLEGYLYLTPVQPKYAMIERFALLGIMSHPVHCTIEVSVENVGKNGS
jgi:hypothetical protein